MKFRNIVDWHLLAFYLMGQNSYIPLLKTRNYFLVVLSFTPTILLMLAACSISIIAIVWQLLLVVRFDRTDSIVGSLFILSELFASLTVIGQSLIRWKYVLEVIETYQSIELYLRQRFHLKIDYGLFIKQYLMRVLLIMCLFLLMVAMKIVLPTLYTILFLEIAFCIMRFLSVVAKLHTLFYVSLLKTFINISTEETFANKSKMLGVILWSHRDIIETMKELKFLHYKLFTAAGQISDVFGWSLVTQSVQSFFDGAYAFYWVFFYLQKEKQEQFIIRTSIYYNLFDFNGFYLVCLWLIFYLLYLLYCPSANN